jgi:hypothetical protein
MHGVTSNLVALPSRSQRSNDRCKPRATLPCVDRSAATVIAHLPLALGAMEVCRSHAGSQG